MLRSSDRTASRGRIVDSGFRVQQTHATARPRGHTEIARLTVNLDGSACSALRMAADRGDVPVFHLAWRAIVDSLMGEELPFAQPRLLQIQFHGGREPVR